MKIFNPSYIENEYHPSADSAMQWFKKCKYDTRYAQVKEKIAITALAGNRTAEICHETLKRLENGTPVSDIYLLGLCWFLIEYMTPVWATETSLGGLVDRNDCANISVAVGE